MRKLSVGTRLSVGLYYLVLIFIPYQASADSHPVWAPTGDAVVLSTALSFYRALDDAQLRMQINELGRDNPHNLEMVDVTYKLATLYALTANESDAHRVVVLLQRFSQVFPYWVERFQQQVADGVITNPLGSGSGIWSDWFHFDLERAQKLAEAFDLISQSETLAAFGAVNTRVLRDFLFEVVRVDLREFPLYLFNLVGYRALALAVFGRVLDDPELVHLGYWYYNKMIHEEYTFDGFHQEGSYSYHYPLTTYLTSGRYPHYLNGYSDPIGYLHLPFEAIYDRPRFDALNLSAQFANQWQRMISSWTETTAPGGQFAILNDTKWSPTAYGTPPEKSVLLSGIGHAVLVWGAGVTQTQVRLDFSHSAGHFHRDANHLIVYAKGKEVLGGTGYLEGDREWNTSTFNQNLIVVNRKEQKGNYWIYYTESPYIPGEGRRPVRQFPFASNNPAGNVHNNVLLWDGGQPKDSEVQLVEVDASDAYRNDVSRYRRFLAMVHISDNEVYLIDLFRVRGGNDYHWTLHGGHQNYQLSLPNDMVATSERLGQMSLIRKLSFGQTVSATFDYGAVKERSLVAAKVGTTIYRGSARASLPGDPRNQDYFVLHRRASALEEEAYLAVHETYNATPHVQRIERLEFDGADGTAIGLAIFLDDGTIDYAIHTLDPSPYLEHKVSGISNFTVRGRFAHVRVKAGQVSWIKLVQGKSVRFGDQTFKAESGDFSYRGSISRVNRIESGYIENSFELAEPLPKGAAVVGRAMIVTWGNGWKWAYTIKAVSGTKVVIAEDPGFEFSGNAIDMRYFPRGQYSGPLEYLIPGGGFVMNQAASGYLSGKGLISNSKKKTKRVINYAR